MCFESTGGKSWQIPKDCEGFGSTESDKTRDAKLMSLCMLFLGLVNGAPTCIYIYCIWINMDQVKCPGFLRSFCSTPRQAHSRHSHIDFVIFRDSCWILLAFEGMIGDAWMHGSCQTAGCPERGSFQRAFVGLQPGHSRGTRARHKQTRTSATWR